MKKTLLPLLALVSGCPSSSSTAKEHRRTAELADQLVSCQNERSALKEQLASLQLELSRLKEQLAAAPAAPVPRAGRTLPRLPSHDVLAARPTLPQTRLDTTGAEERAAQEMGRILRSNGHLLRPCYERGLKRNTNLQFVSQIKVRLTVTPDGRTRDVHISPRTEGDMEACIAQIISRWHVPHYRGQPVVVEMPVSLKVQQ
ncbi:MAG: AgmX/PglI C-terminal domain-containing protein [Myxococcales bacterium]|nr:AgmX/PglI C-terminal domain-containing protein [Myxococcota bacterium]MDW8280577.1 AgmX/PglI C-terminal domain-containing protein [Myxococcales bacterium]